MYIPEYFRVRDHATALAFMQNNPFAILVSSTETGPFATHVPLVIQQREDQLTLRGHVARANPHWKHLENNPDNTLVIFHGPHAYVSPANYNTREAVPTWNYGTVHVYGNARVLSAPEELLAMLHQLIPMFDPAYGDQWATLSQSYRERMLSHIVGFEITVSTIEAKFKLSQNRTREEQENVVRSLSGAKDTTISAIANLMREQGLGTKKR